MVLLPQKERLERKRLWEQEVMPLNVGKFPYFCGNKTIGAPFARTCHRGQETPSSHPKNSGRTFFQDFSWSTFFCCLKFHASAKIVENKR
jgi:hypothetical protein